MFPKKSKLQNVALHVLRGQLWAQRLILKTQCPQDFNKRIREMIPKYTSWGKDTQKSARVVRHHRMKQKKLLIKASIIHNNFRWNFRTKYMRFCRDLGNLRSLFSPIATSFSKILWAHPKKQNSFDEPLQEKLLSSDLKNGKRFFLKTKQKLSETWFNPEFFFSEKF